MESVAAANGEPLDKVELRFTKMYERGVFTTGAIKNGERVFFVPSHTLFTYEKAATTPLGAFVAGLQFPDPTLAAAQPYVVMAVGLLQLREWLRKSEVDPAIEVLRLYVESLPWGSREHPLFYSPTLLC